MVDNLKAGSVVVDLAAAAGGNCVATKKDEAIVTDAGVTVIGYTDLNSRLASTSSSLYANNQMKWLLSAGPTTTKVKGELALDHDDIAIRGEWSRLATRTRHSHAPLARATRTRHAHAPRARATRTRHALPLLLLLVLAGSDISCWAQYRHECWRAMQSHAGRAGAPCWQGQLRWPPMLMLCVSQQTLC